MIALLTDVGDVLMRLALTLAAVEMLFSAFGGGTRR